MEKVDEFLYLSSYVSKDVTVGKEIITSVGSSAAAFNVIVFVSSILAFSK